MKRTTLLFFIISTLLFSQNYTNSQIGQNNDLMKSIENNDIESVRNILRDGNNLDIYNNKYGMSSLMYASKIGNMEIVKELLDFGAKDFNFAFYTACMEGYWDIAQKFIENGANNFDMALSYAAIGGQLDIVKELINFGAKDINATDRNGNNILIRAVMFEYEKEDDGIYRIFSTSLEIMEELLKAGADMTQRNIYGNTAYRIAAKKKKKDFIELFDRYRE